ncbi:hypothetical protein [Streptomyces malaysiensis]|uniref:hypothetical protein n=1 Tax=Streptomyces malaysiensis TaxID=92644 RepID=UPI002B2CA9F2|nr:hypothetical protein R8789_46035 [Streptomyces malaysiensis]
MTTETVTAQPSAPVRHAPLPPGQEIREAPTTWWQTEETREQVLERTLALPFTADSDTNQRSRRRGLIKLLDWLEDQPGRTWQERWVASGAEEAGREWTRLPMQWLAEQHRARKYDRADLCCGMIPLLGGQVVRPAYRWLLRQRPSQLLVHIRSVTDPDGFTALKDQYAATGHAGANDCNNALNRVTWIVTRKGGTVHDVTIGDCVELQHAIGEHQTNGYHGKHLFHALLAGLRVFGPDAPARLKTVMLPGQLTPAALVDRHGITCTAIRDLLVDYLTERAVDVDYTTLEDMARTLAGLFWRDLEKHHPGIDSLRLDADTVTAWRERVRMIRDRDGIPSDRASTCIPSSAGSGRSTRTSPVGPPKSRRGGAHGSRPARSATATPTMARPAPASKRPWTSAPAPCCPHSRPWSKPSSASSRTPRPVSPPGGRARPEPRSPLRRASPSSAAPGCPPASTPTTPPPAGAGT